MYNGLVPHNLTINNNIFKNNTRGLYIDNGYNNTIEGNIFNSNVVGLQLDLSFLNCICKNTLISNFIGINLAVSYLNSITSNNFLSNNITVIMYLSTNLWYANYWNKPRSLPKPIIGILPFVQFDWHPAKEPYDILGMS
jgi:parallel beta-helix repeat protein